MVRNFTSGRMTKLKQSPGAFRFILIQTAPLIAYYRERGSLSEIDGAQPIEKVTADLLAVLGK